MTGQLTSSLPQESDSQLIGRIATKAFHANVPIAWKVTPVDGDNDCGFDFQIQVVDASVVRDIFRVQLKGKTAPVLNVAETEYSVSLDMSTVNYYARTTEPILLVLCDVVSLETATDCKLYYCWIHEELRRIREKGVAANQDSVTFHVPKLNLLQESTELSEDIARFRQLAQLGEQLDVVVEKDRPELSAKERAALTAKLVPNFQSRSATLLDSLTDDSSTSWIEAPEGSLQWLLQEARAALRSGNHSRCQILLDSAGTLVKSARRLEQADYWHGVGRLRIFQLNDADANAAFEKACELSSDADMHVFPWAETKLRLEVRDSGGPKDHPEIQARLTSNSPLITGMKARVTAAEGKYEEALAIAESIDGVEGHVARSIIFTMQAKWTDAINACEIGLGNAAPLKDNTKLFFLILRARARFSLALGLGVISGEEIVLPVNGPAGVDTALLRAAWGDISHAVTMLRTAGWPGNVEAISDIWPHLATMLGFQKEALPVIAEAGDARPSLDILQAGVELLAAQMGDFKLALKANVRQSESDRLLLRRVSLLHLAHRHSECVDLMHLKGEGAVSNAPMLGHAMSLAIFSAEKLVRQDLVSRWTHMLESDPELAPVLAMHRYVSKISNKVLAKDTALDQLEAEYHRLGRPAFLTKQLFHELNPIRPEQAEKLLILADELMKEQLLDADEYLLLAQAFTTLHKWDELLNLSNQAVERFDNSDRLIAVGALALDKLGRAAEAHSRLGELVRKDSPDPFALNTYINIVTISGFTAEAIACLENVLANEADQHIRLQWLRNLFSLIHISDPLSPRLIEIGWQMGQTADQDNEAEEGLFLTSMFSATLHVGATLSDARKEEFQRRIDGYTTKFPNSKILRRFSISEKPSAGEVIQILTDAIGLDEGQIRWREKIENQLAQGMIPVPYAWRPRHVLNNVPDLPTLWERSKTSQWKHRQFHLTMQVVKSSPVNVTRMSGRVPLLDFTALLVVHDLAIFEKLFELFPTIAIGKATLLELQRLMSPWSGSPYRTKCEKIVSALKGRFEQIEQPSADPPEEDGFEKDRWVSQEVIEIAKGNSRFLIYSDDAIFRIYAANGASESQSICTLDVLKMADDARIMGPKEVAQCIAQLCLWRVALVILPRYQLAILPEALATAPSVSKGVDILGGDELCNGLFSGIWHPDQPFAGLQGHIGSLTRDLAENSANDMKSAAAIGAFWVSKVRLYHHSPTPLTRLVALVIAQATYLDRPMTPATSQRLWSMFKSLIELAYDPRMDERTYDESIEMLAKVAVESDQQHDLTGERSIAERIRKGLTDNTSDYEKFVRGLHTAKVSLARQRTP